MPGQRPTTAYWLKSAYEANIWEVADTSAKFRIIWERTLSNGEKLTSAKYVKLLSTSKRFVFDMRSSYLVRQKACAVLRTYVSSLFRLTDWMVYQEDLYQPAKLAFAGLDADGLRDYTRLYVRHGTDGARFIPERLNVVFRSLLEDCELMSEIKARRGEVPGSVLMRNKSAETRNDFEDEEINLLRTWLHFNDAYLDTDAKDIRRCMKVGFLNRYKIGSLLGIEGYKGSPMVDLYLRQFEYVDNYDFYDFMLKDVHRERYGADVLSTRELAERPTSINTVKRTVRDLLAGFARLRPIIDGLPSQDVLESVDAVAIARTAGARPQEHYRTLPAPVALYVLNRAIEYILRYGDAIVDYALSWARKRVELSSGSTLQQEAKMYAFATLAQPTALEDLKIEHLNSRWRGVRYRNEYGGHPGAALCREALSLEDAISFLITSVYIVVATTSARRRVEMIDLELDCVTGVKGAYELNFGLAKANFEGIRERIRRPIPDIAARGLQLLRQFTTEWTNLHGEETEKIFHFPIYAEAGRSLVYQKVDKILDTLCDYIEMPLDDRGRRWYLKSHEFRRFFAIVFFWQYKFASLTALQWMLGHGRPEHTYQYIREVVGGQEMTREEARFTAEALIGELAEGGLKTLAQLAREHFDTDEIALVEEDDLVFYLENLLEEGVYRVRPYAIGTLDGTQHEMVFEIMRKGRTGV